MTTMPTSYIKLPESTAHAAQSFGLGIESAASMLQVFAGLTASVMSMLTTAVVLKDGEPLSLAWTTRDHLQSFCLVMFCTISMDLMYGFRRISPVSGSISNALSGSAVMMEYSMTLFGDSASSSTACKTVAENITCLNKLYQPHKARRTLKTIKLKKVCSKPDFIATLAK